MFLVKSAYEGDAAFRLLTAETMGVVELFFIHSIYAGFHQILYQTANLVEVEVLNVYKLKFN